MGFAVDAAAEAIKELEITREEAERALDLVYGKKEEFQSPISIEHNGDTLKVGPSGDSTFPWGWELQNKDGVYGSVETREAALGSGMQEWLETYPEDFA